jgi:hypothetical protein
MSFKTFLYRLEVLVRLFALHTAFSTGKGVKIILNWVATWIVAINFIFMKVSITHLIWGKEYFFQFVELCKNKGLDIPTISFS